VPVALVQEFDVEAGDRSTANYDAVAATLKEHDAPKGLIFHTAGFTPDNVFRVFAVWESPEDAQRFIERKLLPTVQLIASQSENAGPPDRQYTYPLHDLQRAPSPGEG
jgi:hypothetical protein